MRSKFQPQRFRLASSMTLLEYLILIMFLFSLSETSLVNKISIFLSCPLPFSYSFSSTTPSSALPPFVLTVVQLSSTAPSPSLLLLLLPFFFFFVLVSVDSQLFMFFLRTQHHSTSNKASLRITMVSTT